MLLATVLSNDFLQKDTQGILLRTWATPLCAAIYVHVLLHVFSTRVLRAPHVVADEAKLAIVFGPGVLACATRGGGRSEAGHCFHLLFSFFFFFFFFFFFLRLLLFTHFGESPVRENLFSPIFWHN